jgi:hypothetical protein
MKNSSVVHISLKIEEQDATHINNYLADADTPINQFSY